MLSRLVAPADQGVYTHGLLSIFNQFGSDMYLKQFVCFLTVLMLCVVATAEQEFMLAYYVEIDNAGETFVLQQHGQRLSLGNEIFTPIGRGGRGRFSLRLLSLDKESGMLRLEIFSDAAENSAVRAPRYSLDIEFSPEGAKGDVVDSSGDVSINLSYSIVTR